MWNGFLCGKWSIRNVSVSVDEYSVSYGSLIEFSTDACTELEQRFAVFFELLEEEALGTCT